MNRIAVPPSLLSHLGSSAERRERALAALRDGRGVIVVDDEDRENEGDVIFAADTITTEQVNLMIRTCTGIVCLVLTDETADRLELPFMVPANSSKYGTPFTVSIEAKAGVATGVSAADRAHTIRTAAAPGTTAEDLARPGHIFPLRAHPQGLRGRRGHTEATIDLMRLAGLKPSGVLCEVMNADGTMARLPELIAYAETHGMPIVTIDDLIV